MLTETTTRRVTLAKAVGILAVLYAVTFLLGARLHLGVRIPLGFTVLAEPRIYPAAIVEGLCSLVLAVGAYAVLTRKSWARDAITGAHIFSLGGVLLGTVRNYLSTAIKKLGVRNRVEAARLAEQKGWL
jgi:hypothetical protein